MFCAACDWVSMCGARQGVAPSNILKEVSSYDTVGCVTSTPLHTHCSASGALEAIFYILLISRRAMFRLNVLFAAGTDTLR